MYVHMHTHKHTSAHAYTHTQKHTHTHTHTYIHTHTHTHTHICSSSITLRPIKLLNENNDFQSTFFGILKTQLIYSYYSLPWFQCN